MHNKTYLKSLLGATTVFCITYILLMIIPVSASAQSGSAYIRVARIVVDSSKVSAYNAALKEGIETAVRTEPGVITLYAVHAKDDPTQVTVFEIYADMAAYNFHIQTAHFKKYKNTVQDMVKSLMLVDVDPIAMASKGKQ